MNDWFEITQVASALLKGSVALLVTSLFATLLRSSSATNLYRVWFFGTCMALLVAVASFLAPIFNLDVPLELAPLGDGVANRIAGSQIFHSAASLGEESAETGNITPPSGVWSARSLVNAQQSRSGDHRVNDELIHERREAVKSVDRMPFDQSKVSGVASHLSLTTSLEAPLQFILSWWPTIWLLGAIAVLLHTCVQHWRAIDALRRCERPDDRALSQLCREVAQQVGVPAPELLVLDEAVTPFVVGVWKPRIILPSESSCWSRRALTFVMLHELAHIKRRDLCTQLISRMAVAVYWFNPFSWWGYFQLIRLRELACDDWVLQREKQPSSYAETLLDVATKYRSHREPAVIGMSSKLDISQRIHSVLDATRARTPFTKRTSRCLAGAALAICLAFGAMQLRSSAVEPQTTTNTGASEQRDAEPTGDSQNEKVIDEEARSSLIKVLDENSQPLSGVDVYVTGVDRERRGGKGNLPRIHYPTDATGETTIRFRQGTLTLQLWCRKPGYVPQHVRFDEKKMTLPAEYTFHFEKGTKVGGKLVDDLGNPIKGATVQVKTSGRAELNERSKESLPPAHCTSWLATGDAAAVTNDQGEWEIDNAPSAGRNPELQFELLVDHSDFAGDRYWGGYQKKGGITVEQLRTRTATLVMDRGAVLRGRISGPDGKPVTRGLVIWVPNPYFATGVNEVQIQSDGTFQLPNLELGKYPITVLAPGFAPEQREVELSQGSPSCDFQLEPGNSIRIEIVDAKGRPIPNASVSFARQGWRGTTAIYNDKHSSVPESGIPRRADDNGVFRWSWAPPDGVKYDISARGYDSKSVTLLAKEEAHRIVLTSPLTISGRVVDKDTGKPIPRFQVMPVKAFRPDFYSTDFQETRVAAGENGQYEIQIDTHGDSTDRYRVRIEAEGYRTAFGKSSLAAGDPALVEDFRMESAEPLVGHVVNASKNPVFKFQVAIGTPTTSPDFEFDRPNRFFGQAFQVDGQDTFEIAASFEPQRIRVFNEDGFAEVLVEPEKEEIGQVVLQPYAKVSGRLMQGDIPIGVEGIYFFPLVQRGLKEARFQDSFFTQTDPSGYFEFKRLPPMVGTVRAYLGPWEESRLTSSQWIPLELKPGEHQQLILSGNGVSVTGRVVAKGRSDDEFSKRWSLNWLVSRKAGIRLPAWEAPLSIPNDAGPIQDEWLKRTDFSAWRITKDNHYVKLRDDGYFWIHGVPEGEYDLVIQLFEQPAGCLVEAVGTRVVPVTVSNEQISAGELDLGRIEVVCRSGPRPGSDMRAYEFVDSDGRVLNVNDVSGRYLLFHVWASWCQPCLDSMPQLKADVAALEETSLTAVGLNVDADQERGRTLAAKLELDWAQNYLGEDSDLARQLAISSVPAYYLVGPDGKLVGSSSDWKAIRQLLEKN